jgi:hypothetical protein
MGAFQNFLRIGNREEYPKALNERLKQTVVIGLLLIGFVSLHLVSSLLKGGIKPAIFTIAEMSWILAAFALLKAGTYRVPRVMVAVAPVLTTYIATGNSLSPGEEVSSGIYMMLLASSSIPFVLFGFKERFWLIVALLIDAFCLFTVPQSSEWFFGLIELGKVAESTGSDFISHFSAIVGLFSILYFKESENHKATALNEKMQHEAQEKQTELQMSEQELKKMLAQIEENRKEERLRSQAAEKLSDFATLLRDKHAEIGEQYDEIISFIVKSVKANQGSLYLVEGDETEKYLTQKACYAYDRKKYLEHKIDIGEGLCGQAYLEKDYIMLTEVPQDYLSITSGLGEANPNCLFILPMLYQEEVQVILELASFEVLQQHQIEMLKKMGEALASQVAAYRIQYQTRVLLEKSQMQAEELQSREEELRQNMEELQGTQEDMQRKEKYYVDRIAELEKALD